MTERRKAGRKVAGRPAGRMCLLDDRGTFRADGLRPGNRLTFSPLVPKDIRVRRF